MVAIVQLTDLIPLQSTRRLERNRDLEIEEDAECITRCNKKSGLLRDKATSCLNLGLELNLEGHRETRFLVRVFRPNQPGSFARQTSMIYPRLPASCYIEAGFPHQPLSSLFHTHTS
ncbi:hypothetical protein RRG08_013106 [Elysia crispata]|uniref:Uncharacterized protein n=1 Tax=Elysia crispata TaxID=231223 RepID=A0AAE1A0K3_9GAST|nr:hypothetical protein RRG08_013106 [Elysia crispata]